MKSKLKQLWKDLAWTTGDKIIAACLVLAVLWAAVEVRQDYLAHSTPAPSSPAHSPEFSSNTCFAHNGIREPWEPLYDGLVIMVGYKKYIVMYQGEADRRHGGAKTGWEEDIEKFDARYHPTTCPDWKRTAGKKPQHGRVN